MLNIDKSKRELLGGTLSAETKRNFADLFKKIK
jgi:hypothetical protein